MSKPSVGYFYQRLLFYTVTPILFAAVFGLYSCLHVARNSMQRLSKSRRRNTEERMREEEDEAEDESSIMCEFSFVNPRFDVNVVEMSLSFILNTALCTDVFLFFCSVIVVPVSSIIFKTFACVIVNDEGDAYLQYDLSQPCYNRQHNWWTLYAGLFIFIYPVSHSTIRCLDSDFTHSDLVISEGRNPAVLRYPIAQSTRRHMAEDGRRQACLTGAP